MKVKAVVVLAAVAVCSSAQMLSYPSVLGGISSISLGSNFGSFATSHGPHYSHAAPVIKVVAPVDAPVYASPDPLMLKIKGPDASASPDPLMLKIKGPDASASPDPLMLKIKGPDASASPDPLMLKIKGPDASASPDPLMLKIKGPDASASPDPLMLKIKGPDASASPDPLMLKIKGPDASASPDPLMLKIKGPDASASPDPLMLKIKSPAITLEPAAPIASHALAPAHLTYGKPSVAPIAHMAPLRSQHHTQDVFGQYSFGFNDGFSSRSEMRDAFGVVHGSYNYLDADGQVQTQKYVADARGFRVAGTNLPVAPDAQQPAPLALPKPVEDTPEVAAAKADFQKAYNEAAAAAYAAPESRKKRSVMTPTSIHSPLGFSYAFQTPLHYSYPTAFPYTTAHPAYTTYSTAIPGITTYPGVPAVTTYTAGASAVVDDAELMKVVHNPGHATSFRVY